MAFQGSISPEREGFHHETRRFPKGLVGTLPKIHVISFGTLSAVADKTDECCKYVASLWDDPHPYGIPHSE